MNVLKKVWMFVVPMLFIAGLTVTAQIVPVSADASSIMRAEPTGDEDTNDQAMRDVTEAEAKALGDLHDSLTGADSQITADEQAVIVKALQPFLSLDAKSHGAVVKAAEAIKASITGGKARKATKEQLRTAVNDRDVRGALLSDDRILLESAIVAAAVEADKEGLAPAILLEFFRHEIVERVAAQDGHQAALIDSGVLYNLGVLASKQTKTSHGTVLYKDAEPGKVILQVDGDVSDYKGLADQVVNDVDAESVGANDVVVYTDKAKIQQGVGKPFLAEIGADQDLIVRKAQVNLGITIARLVYTLDPTDAQDAAYFDSVINSVWGKSVAGDIASLWAEVLQGNVDSIIKLAAALPVAALVGEDWVSRVHLLNDVLGKL